MKIWNIYINISSATWYLVSVLLQCSGNACEQYAEDLGFESGLHFFLTQISIGMYWYVLVCTGMYQYVPVYMGMYSVTGMYWYVLVCTSLYL
jgi:hypothetical protein